MNTYLGITDENITINGYKNGSSNVIGFNKDGSTRLYADSSKGNGGYLEIILADGYAIKSITITYTKDSKTPSVLLADSTVLTGKDDVYSVGTNKVTIKNTQTSGQVQINSIVIVYGSVTAE